MTAPYKKRAKAGWNSDKEQSNRDERAFIKQDLNSDPLISADLEDLVIKGELQSGESTEVTSETPTKKSKKKLIKAKDITNKIHAIERKLDYFKSRQGTGSFSDWIKKVIHSYEKELEELKARLK